MEMLYEPPLVTTAPFLVQVYSTGGITIQSEFEGWVSIHKINDDDWRVTVLLYFV